MPSLSFDKTKGAKPIAIVKGGQYDGEVLYLHEDDHKGKKPKMNINPTRYATEMRGLKPMEKVQMIRRLEEAKSKGLSPDQLVGETALAKQLYERILLDETRDKMVELPDDGQFQLLPSPDPKAREVYYIAGASGSGKSYFAKGFAECYKKLYPEREVYLISKLKEDETLDALPFIKRLDIQSFIDDYPELEEFENCLTLWDDFDTLTGPAAKVVQKLIDDLATMGRHTCSTMLVMSHYLTNYKATRLILNEATHIVVYPAATAYHPLKYLLRNYVGVDEDDLKDMRKWGSRWLCVRKNYPQCVVAQQKAKMLHAD